MAAYEEAKATHGLIIQGDPAGPCKSNPRLVKPSLTDFICDVELVLQKVLRTEQQWGEFNMVLCSAIEPNCANKIKQRVGRELIEREISPLSEYLKGREVIRGV